MAARRNRPVLYEVAGRSKRLRGAGRTRQPREAEPESLRRVRPTPMTDEPLRAAPAETPPAPQSQLSAESAKAGPGWLERLGTTASRLPSISASGASGAFIIAAVVVVIVVATMAVRNWSPSEVDPGAGAAPAVALGDSAPESGGASSLAADAANEPPAHDAASQTAAGAPPTVELQRGLHYVVVQHFPKSKRRAADAAAKYLRENGIECALLPGADIRLIATQPFHVKQADRRAADSERRRGESLVNRIKQLGKAYNRIGGYDFRGAQLRELK